VSDNCRREQCLPPATQNYFIRTDIDPLSGLVVLPEETTRRIAVPDGANNHSRHRRFLDLRGPHVVGAVQGHNVSEALVPFVVVSESTPSALESRKREIVLANQRKML